jgi:hypothetical protein
LNATNPASDLLTIARELAEIEGPRVTAGRLINAAALILAERGVTEADMAAFLRAEFLRFDENQLIPSRRH